MRYSEDVKSRFTARHRVCIEFSGDVKNKVMLDVGCWIGWYEKFMVEKGCKFIVGIDMDFRALVKARKSFSADRCEFVCASAHKLPFKPGSFDTVSMFDVLEHSPLRSEFGVLSEANKVLNTGGLLLVSVPNNHFIIKLLDPAYFLMGHRHYALEEISGLTKKTGFNVYEVKYGGGVAEALSMVLLYLFKHLFGMEVPFKSFFEHQRNNEYQGEGFATLFIKADKSAVNKKDAGRKRIIFLFNSFVSISGGDTRFIEVFKRLKDFNKVIITPSIGRKICEMKKLNAAYILTTKEIHFKNIFISYFRRIIGALFLKIEIRDEDITYSTSDFLPDVLPAFVYKFTHKRAKWVVAFHLIAPNPFYGSDQYYSSHKKFRKPTIESLFYKATQLFSLALIRWKADKVLTVNSEIYDYLVKKVGLGAIRTMIVNNGVDISKFLAVNQPKNKIYDAVFVGRFHQQKSISDLIRIWELVCKEKPDAKLALIGRGFKEEQTSFEKEILARGLTGNIKMLGFLNEKEKILTLKSSKLFLFPSSYESWGIVAVEAMACGLPVLAWDLPVFREIFPNGLIRFSKGDISEFASTVLNLLCNDALLNSIGKQALETAKKYDWNQVALRESEILLSI